MPRRDDHDANSGLRTLAVVAAVVVVLYFASEVILPLVLAALLTFLLTPPVTWLERHRLGRVPSVLAVTGMTFALLVGIGWIVADQFIDLLKQLPDLTENVAIRIESVKSAGPLGAGTGGILATQ